MRVAFAIMSMGFRTIIILGDVLEVAYGILGEYRISAQDVAKQEQIV